MHILSVEAISKDYGLRPVLENVSLGLNRDDRVGVVGANGSGKTTFLRLIAGDAAPSPVFEAACPGRIERRIIKVTSRLPVMASTPSGYIAKVISRRGSLY